MAVSHIYFNEQSQYGRLIRRALNLIEDGLDNLNDTIGVITVMIDGDGSQADHFTYATTKFGFGSDADTKAAYEELQSLAFKLNTNASITDMNAALLQAFNKFR